ncbi:MAG TPA: ankyrin repeat domain-containing protein [Burkholderiales bacterium]|nr:ankyrin repeat domain-containing protein [Burkholderiales bacterium]
MTAVIYSDPKTVEQLLKLGKWPDKPDSRGVTALMLASMFGDAASAEALLKAGANPNWPGPGGITATSLARERQNGAMVGLLQRYGGK